MYKRVIKFSALCVTLLSLACSSLLGQGERRASFSPNSKTLDVSPMARDSFDQSPRKRVLVLPFIPSPQLNAQKTAEVARQSVLRELVQADRFVIVRNEDFPKDLSSFFVNDQYDLEAVAKLAFGMGVAVVIEGKVLNINAKRKGDQVGVFRKIKAQVEASVRVRALSTKNLKEILNEVRQADVESTTTQVAEYTHSDQFLREDPQLIEAVIKKAFAGAIGQIQRAVDRLSWEGRLAMVSGEKIYLNAGRLSGLQVGDLLKVTEEPEEIYDPQTGLLIGEVPGRMKGTVEVVGYFGRDGAIAVVHSGSGFRENDRVEVY